MPVLWRTSKDLAIRFVNRRDCFPFPMNALRKYPRPIIALEFGNRIQLWVVQTFTTPGNNQKQIFPLSECEALSEAVPRQIKSVSTLHQTKPNLRSGVPNRCELGLWSNCVRTVRPGADWQSPFLPLIETQPTSHTN